MRPLKTAAFFGEVAVCPTLSKTKVSTFKECLFEVTSGIFAVMPDDNTDDIRS
jgi:hypothetical protein